MTWLEAQTQTLDKLFARVRDGADVSLNAPEVVEYVKAMPALANFAMLDLCAICPIYQKIIYPIDTPRTGWRTINLLLDNLIRILPTHTTLCQPDGVPMPIDGLWVEGETIRLPGALCGTLHIWCEMRPPQLTESTPGYTTLPLDEEAVCALPLYMAAQLGKEEDSAMSVQYLNEYEAVKAALRVRPRRIAGNQGFVSMTGWI